MTNRAGIAIAAVAAVLVVGAGAVGLITQDDSTPVSPVSTVTLAASATPVFSEGFDTAAGFYDRFDYGLSGGSPANRDDPEVPGAGGVFPAHGDHNMACGPPVYGDESTERDVQIHGEQWTNANPYPNITFDELFWWCAPGGDSTRGHMMTGFTTTGYNHLWFAPKDEYTGIQKVCYDVNETSLGGKWIEIQFVDHADAIRYPTGSQTPGGTARGTGGFDLGYTEPTFRPEATGGNSQVGPNTGLQPRSGTLAGIKVDTGATIYTWWQDQDFVKASGIGWPGFNANPNQTPAYNTDKATRYKHCMENGPNNTIVLTDIMAPGGQSTPQGGSRSFTIPGQIPQDARRVVFHDAEYDGPKRGGYDAHVITWHWDNIQIFTSGIEPPPPGSTTTLQPPPTTTVPPTSSTAPPSTTAPTTTSPTTTAPSTTAPTTSSTTTTVAPTTTRPPTTTTTAPAPTTTLAPIPACPSTFSNAERRWCAAVNAHIARLEAKVG